jgi:hypothetical protein
MGLEGKVKEGWKKLKRKRPSKRGFKRFLKENIWAIGFGLGYGLLYGGDYADLQDAGTGVAAFGVIFPAVYKMMGHHKTWPDAAWHGAKGATSYVIANCVGKFIHNALQYVT